MIDLTFFIVACVVVLGSAANHTFRGGRFIADEVLPGRNLYYATPILGVLAWLLEPPLIALAWMACYFHFCVYAWGHLIGLGRFRPTDRPPSFVDAACLRLAGNDPHGALFFRELLIIPGLVLVAWAKGGGSLFWLLPCIGVVYAALAVVTRDKAWELASPKAEIRDGEIGEGALWGLLIVGVSLL